MRATYGIVAMAFVACFVGTSALSQASITPDKSTSETVETFYLQNASQTNDALEIRSALREVLPPNTSVSFNTLQNALVVRSTPDQLLIAKKLIADLDRPKKIYRISYTITESDGGKRLGTQHFSMVVVSGQRTTLKEGSKVPVSTGSYSSGNSTTQSQFTYLDVGINLDATVDESSIGVRLRSKEEQSSIAESAVGPQDPIVRQSVLEGTSIVSLGKPLILGSLDVPGSTRHLDIEAVVEAIK